MSRAAAPPECGVLVVDGSGRDLAAPLGLSYQRIHQLLHCGQRGGMDRVARLGDGS
jgi:hypothetical protein